PPRRAAIPTAWAAARTGRSRRRRSPAETRQRTPPRARRRRSLLAAACGPSGGGALRGAQLSEELRVDLEHVPVLLGDLEVGEDRVDRAGLHAGVAIDADHGVDIELLRGLEIGRSGLRMYAVGRARVDARVVLDATARDDVGHGASQATYRLARARFRARRLARGRHAVPVRRRRRPARPIRPTRRA